MTRRLLLLALSACTLFAQDGAAIYKKRCAGCHDAPAGRTPPFSALRAMDPARILHSLEGGLMKAQAEGMSSIERHALMSYLVSATPKASAPLPSTAFCAGDTGVLSDPLQGPRWNGWGIDFANTRFQDAAAAGFTAGDVPKLKLKWAFGLGDGIVARALPAIAGGRVFVGSESGAVYSLDARTGCIHWIFQADGGVTAAAIIGTAGPSQKRPAAYFGDQKANVYAVDTATGKLLWKIHADGHFAARVTAASQLHGGVLYVPVASFEEVMPLSPSYECCTFRGALVALDAATGKQVWKTYTITEPPQPVEKSKTGVQMRGPSGASVWSAPTFDEKRHALYVATGNNYSDPPTPTSDAVIALDSKTGKILWSRQLTPNDANNSGCSSPFKTNCPDSDGPDADFGQPPILVSLANGRRALVIGQKSGVAHALDPDKQGEVLWQTRVGQGGPLGGMQWGSAADRENMYVAVSDLQITGVVPDSTAPQGYRLTVDPNKGGGLFALRLTTGEKVWSAKPAPCGERKSCSPAQSAAVTAIPGVVFSGSVDGHLRAYSAANGEVVWDVDTVRDYETVNGQKARGGSLDGPGPTIAGGMLYVNSGYGQWGGMPGNVLLAFSVDGR
jgi:polyvinyl alcohol dehydrogenase (cytochrome)